MKASIRLAGLEVRLENALGITPFDGNRQSTAKKSSFTRGTKKTNTHQGFQPNERSRRSVKTIPDHKNGSDNASKAT